jgi:hypothetical protein
MFTLHSALSIRHVSTGSSLFTAKMVAAKIKINGVLLNDDDNLITLTLL